jgi:hypothetical protein
MYICYVDEAGCPGALPSATSEVQPALVLAGLMIPQVNLRGLTEEFMRLKLEFNPRIRGTKAQHWLDIVKHEIKGSDLRGDVRTGSRNRRRAVLGFLDKVLNALEVNQARLVARIYIKQPAGPFPGRKVYAGAMQSMCQVFQHLLDAESSLGMIVADHRTATLNSMVAHSIFTQKFQQGGDSYPRIVEMPTFGHSENHAPLQITDLICSAILYPMATSTYCLGHVRSCHVTPKDHSTRERYAERLKAMTYRFQVNGKPKGGITVHDAIAHRGPQHMYVPRPQKPQSSGAESEVVVV